MNKTPEPLPPSLLSSGAASALEGLADDAGHRLLVAVAVLTPLLLRDRRRGIGDRTGSEGRQPDNRRPAPNTQVKATDKVQLTATVGPGRRTAASMFAGDSSFGAESMEMIETRMVSTWRREIRTDRVKRARGKSGARQALFRCRGQTMGIRTVWTGDQRSEASS